jgi:hypothetical protein
MLVDLNAQGEDNVLPCSRNVAAMAPTTSFAIMPRLCRGVQHSFVTRFVPPRPQQYESDNDKANFDSQQKPNSQPPKVTFLGVGCIVKMNKSVLNEYNASCEIIWGFLRGALLCSVTYNCDCQMPLSTQELRVF